MIEVCKYNRENTNADFNSDLVVEGVILELRGVQPKVLTLSIFFILKAPLMNNENIVEKLLVSHFKHSSPIQ